MRSRYSRVGDFVDFSPAGGYLGFSPHKNVAQSPSSQHRAPVMKEPGPGGAPFNLRVPSDGGLAVLSRPSTGLSAGRASPEELPPSPCACSAYPRSWSFLFIFMRVGDWLRHFGEEIKKRKRKKKKNKNGNFGTGLLHTLANYLFAGIPRLSDRSTPLRRGQPHVALRRLSSLRQRGRAP